MRNYKSTGYKKRQLKTSHESLARRFAMNPLRLKSVWKIANLFEGDNPRFDRGRFDDRVREYAGLPVRRGQISPILEGRK